MKPFIKWPGGKASEIRQFEYLIPDYDRYIEPFVGGGALFFHLNPEHALINDTSEDLMLLYRLIKEQNSELHRILNLYCRSFGALQETCRKMHKHLLDLFSLYSTADEKQMNLSLLKLHEPLTAAITKAALGDVASDLIPDMDEYLSITFASVEDKLKRTLINNRKSEFSQKDLAENLVTAFTGGFYLYFRQIFNAIRNKSFICSDAYRIANFYFIREYCYGSMFRYNAKGQFNIPYGGISYNKKDLSQKVDQMFSPQVAALMSRTSVCCLDFEEFLNSISLTPRDFLFLDPPYDTEFSEYEQHGFGREDQKRLAQFLYRTPALFLLVIKNTEYINELYRDRFRILSFENRYSYNVRSRNNRSAEHLIITNIPEGQVPWLRENVQEMI